MEQKKMRIQKFDSEWRLLEDKTYKESYELKSGPKEKHDGPLRIEFTLEDASDVDECLEYLKRLKGMVPMESRVKKEPKAAKIKDGGYSPEALVENLRKYQETMTQDGLIKYLRELGFVFTTQDFLECLEPFKDVSFNNEDENSNVQYMVRLIKESKNNPMLDRYDPRLLVAMNIAGKRKKAVYVHYNGQDGEKLIYKVPESPVEVFENQKLFIFPEYMTEKDKEKFRKEYRKMENDETVEPSEFFIRWAKWVTLSKVLPNFKKYVK